MMPTLRARRSGSREFIISKAAFILSALAAPLSAQDPPPINTDRPAFTDSSSVVPQHSLQIENGFLETSASGQHTFDFPESLLRYGLSDKIELRFTVPDYYSNLPTATASATGWSDLLAGFKYQLPNVLGFQLSSVVSLSFPTGSHPISSHGYDPALQLVWSHPLSTNWTAAGMLTAAWPTQGPSRNTTGQTTFLFDRQLTKPWDAFIEYAGTFPQRGGPAHILHFGTAYKLTPNQQLDFHIGVGLSSAAPDHFIGVGYSVIARSPAGK